MIQRKFLLLIAIFGCALTANAALSSRESERIVELEKLYNEQTGLTKDGDYRKSFEYAYLLYKSNDTELYQKADKIVLSGVSDQIYDSNSPDYGLWAWSRGSKIGDKNVPLFLAHYLLVDLWEEQAKMSFETRAAFNLACKRLVEAAERRYDEEVWAVGRSDVAYSNVFALFVETLTVAAERFSDDRLRRKALTQWTRFYNNFLFHGLDEFLSSEYDNLIFNALQDILDFCSDERQKSEVKEMMDFVYLAESAVVHPTLKLPVVGMARDYRWFQRSGDVRVGFLQNAPQNYVVKEETASINEDRKYPFEVVGRAGAMPFVYKSYQLPNVAMGSMTGWGNYFWQQVHCMASAGIDADHRATMFIPGTYTPINGFTDQKELSTLCVYNRGLTLYHLTQWREDTNDIAGTFLDFGVGISYQFEELANEVGKVVLNAYGYDFYLFPYSIKNGKAEACKMELVHRNSTSSKYHSRKADYNEYVFPSEPEWFGVVVKVVKAGQKVTAPKIKFKEEGNITTVTTSDGHKVRVALTEQGARVHLHEKDINLLPRLSIKY